MKLLIRIKLDNNISQEFITSKSSFTLGRSEKNDICIIEDGLSREHCRFDVSQDGEIYITDLNSTNGVLIEGSRVSSGLPIKYLPYLSLRIGPICALEVIHYEVTSDNGSPIDSLVPLAENAKKRRQPELKKKQHYLWIWILILSLMACILYVVFEMNNENKFRFPISPSSLTF